MMKISLISRYCICLYLVALTLVSISYGEERYMISGTVSIGTSHGSTLSGATIVLKDGEGQVISSVQTGENGLYIMLVPDGMYTLRASKQHYDFDPVTSDVEVEGQHVYRNFTALPWNSCRNWGGPEDWASKEWEQAPNNYSVPALRLKYYHPINDIDETETEHVGTSFFRTFCIDGVDHLMGQRKKNKSKIFYVGRCMFTFAEHDHQLHVAGNEVAVSIFINTNVLNRNSRYRFVWCVKETFNDGNRFMLSKTTEGGNTYDHERLEEAPDYPNLPIIQ